MKRLTALECSQKGCSVEMAAYLASIRPLADLVLKISFGYLSVLDLSKHAVCGNCTARLEKSGVKMTSILIAEECLAERIHNMDRLHTVLPPASVKITDKIGRRLGGKAAAKQVREFLVKPLTRCAEIVTAEERQRKSTKKAGQRRQHQKNQALLGRTQAAIAANQSA